jgi:hypothetical protein
MRTPFPGMDPYLEHPGLWSDVQDVVIARVRDELAPRLRPRYTVLEILSPANKCPVQGRRLHEH